MSSAENNKQLIDSQQEFSHKCRCNHAFEPARRIAAISIQQTSKQLIFNRLYTKTAQFFTLNTRVANFYIKFVNSSQQRQHPTASSLKLSSSPANNHQLPRTIHNCRTTSTISAATAACQDESTTYVHGPKHRPAPESSLQLCAQFFLPGSISS